MKRVGAYDVAADYYAQHSANSYVYLLLYFLTFVEFCLLGNWQVLVAQFIIEFHCLLSGINFYVHFFPRDGGTWRAGVAQDIIIPNFTPVPSSGQMLCFYRVLNQPEFLAALAVQNLAGNHVKIDLSASKNFHFENLANFKVDPMKIRNLSMK